MEAGRPPSVVAENCSGNAGSGFVGRKCAVESAARAFGGGSAARDGRQGSFVGRGGGFGVYERGEQRRVRVFGIAVVVVGRRDAPYITTQR